MYTSNSAKLERMKVYYCKGLHYIQNDILSPEGILSLVRNG